MSDESEAQVLQPAKIEPLRFSKHHVAQCDPDPARPDRWSIYAISDILSPQSDRERMVGIPAMFVVFGVDNADAMMSRLDAAAEAAMQPEDATALQVILPRLEAFLRGPRGNPRPRRKK